MDRESVRGCGEANVAYRAGDEVNLMWRTPDAQDLMDGPLGQLYDKSVKPALHGVLAVRSNQDQLDALLIQKYDLATCKPSCES